MSRIKQCPSCRRYTLAATCCHQATIASVPAKYSPEDKYARYRRQAKQQLTRPSR